MAEKINTVIRKETITEIVRVKQVVMERPVAYTEGITSMERAGRLDLLSDRLFQTKDNFLLGIVIELFISSFIFCSNWERPSFKHFIACIINSSLNF